MCAVGIAKAADVRCTVMGEVVVGLRGCCRSAGWVLAVVCSFLLAVSVMGKAVSASDVSGETAEGTPGIPAGLPEAAHRSSPSLPEPDNWPFGDAFPRTSGVGRLASGALFWSDFIYDDYGAQGLSRQQNPSSSTPAGTFGYSDDAAANNGADLFRLGIGVQGADTVWRVDWNTLIDPCLPVAMFGLTTSESQEVHVWPANAGVSAQGSDLFVLMTCENTWIIADGEQIPVDSVGGTHQVDSDARSYVAHIPAPAIGASGKWQARIVSGLANQERDGFRQLNSDEGALPGQPNVYNVGFRTVDQEQALDSRWMDAAQAEALTSGDITTFWVALDWEALRRRDATPEPLVRGYSNRWYISSLDLGQGYLSDNEPTTRARYLGRVQPYAIYVPTSYDQAAATPLTMLPHGGSANHNQWVGGGWLDWCDRRGAICVSPLGRSHWGWFLDEGEVDFLEVLNRVWLTYHVDPDRLTIAGVSMGGWAAYKFGLHYPDVFSAVLAMAAPSHCGGLTEAGGVDLPPWGDLFYTDDNNRRCVPRLESPSSGNTAPLVENARWVSFAISQGPDDPLVPFTTAVEQVQRFDHYGYRYLFDVRTPRGHALYTTDPDLEEFAWYLDRWTRERNPAHVTVNWHPNNIDPDLGIGTHRAWWLPAFRAHDGHPADFTARIDALSHALPRHEIATERRSWQRAGELGLLIFNEQDWALGAQEPAFPLIELELQAVRDITIDVTQAGLEAFNTSQIHVTTDSNITITLAHTSRAVRPTHPAPIHVDDHGNITIRLPAGQHQLHLAAATTDSQDKATTPTPTTSLPATGSTTTAGIGLLLLTLALISPAPRRAVRRQLE